MSIETEDTVKICHFSDLHLSLERAPRIWQLLGKRALGYANLRFNRGKTHKIEAFRSLLNHVAAQNADLIVVTGDFTSLALEHEFEAVNHLFVEAGLKPEKLLVVPGNHDRYTPSAVFGGTFERGMSSWLPQSSVIGDKQPQLKIVGPIAVIGVDTAVWRGPISAAGRITSKQIAQILGTLELEDIKGKWPVIALHHPPFHLRRSGLRDYRTGLHGVDNLVSSLGNRAVTLIHGHLHKVSRRQIGNLDIIGVPSASNDSGKMESQLAYNTYCFGNNGLHQAFASRHWPGETDTEKQFERIDLKDESIVD